MREGKSGGEGGGGGGSDGGRGVEGGGREEESGEEGVWLLPGLNGEKVGELDEVQV